ncbi:hypothetical protein Epro_0255 [Endomicrobium proavitum]|uniref:Uncharacterized protein n=1 Tax=Endomicrobium proavitum TaxID=1408281 RepID=A0A0G3WJG2_9BACT|nr:hypothetical protein Epro_0255 [Endomicrobium proavitum]
MKLTTKTIDYKVKSDTKCHPVMLFIRSSSTAACTVVSKYGGIQVY